MTYIPKITYKCPWIFHKHVESINIVITLRFMRKFQDLTFAVITTLVFLHEEIKTFKISRHQKVTFSCDVMSFNETLWCQSFNYVLNDWLNVLHLSVYNKCIFNVNIINVIDIRKFNYPDHDRDRSGTSCQTISQYMHISIQM